MVGEGGIISATPLPGLKREPSGLTVVISGLVF